jgi:leucyl aminopeptidase
VGHGRRRRGRRRDEGARLRKAKANVVGVCGLVENMPDGNAQRPGDVVTSMSARRSRSSTPTPKAGSCWPTRSPTCSATYKPETMVDLATLTGAILISARP